MIRKFLRVCFHMLPKTIQNFIKYIRFDDSSIIYKNSTFKDYFESAIHDFYSDSPLKEFPALRKDMILAYLEDGTRPDEYLLYHYEQKDEQQRREYLPQSLKGTILIQYYKDKAFEIVELLQNKYALYCTLKAFYRRDAVCIRSPQDKDKFIEFCNKHNKFIAKELDGHCGVGVQIISLDNTPPTTIFYQLLDKGQWIVEELIQQNAEISQFNPSSINTVRFPSFRHGNKVISAYPCMRFGRQGSIVDNAGQGGVFVSIDIRTGKIITDGYDEHGHKFECHPDSGVKFKGFIVPQWHELLSLAKEAHLRMPENQTYVAFDFALSVRGWVIVEGNWGDYILQQVSLGRGLKKSFVDMLHN